MRRERVGERCEIGMWAVSPAAPVRACLCPMHGCGMLTAAAAAVSDLESDCMTDAAASLVRVFQQRPLLSLQHLSPVPAPPACVQSNTPHPLSPSCIRVVNHIPFPSPPHACSSVAAPITLSKYASPLASRLRSETRERERERRASAESVSRGCV